MHSQSVCERRALGNLLQSGLNMPMPLKIPILSVVMVLALAAVSNLGDTRGALLRFPAALRVCLLTVSALVP